MAKQVDDTVLEDTRMHKSWTRRSAARCFAVAFTLLLALLRVSPLSAAEVTMKVGLS